MQKLISELTRLYLSTGTLSPDVLQRHVLGETTAAISLAGKEGRTRAIVIDFRKMTDGDSSQHWELLCEVANALQAQLGLPAPAVSISGADGFALWLSLEAPVAAAVAQQFLELLRRAYFPGVDLAPDAASAPVELPPCRHQRTGKWAAFINPGLGASFTDESGLEMAPPFAGQAALLEGLHSITPVQFARAMETLQATHEAAPVVAAPVAAPPSDGLLLKDATLEDIVRHLHAKNIEPTFRHLIR
jgi:hypothetical protein